MWTFIKAIWALPTPSLLFEQFCKDNGAEEERRADRACTSSPTRRGTERRCGFPTRGFTSAEIVRDVQGKKKHLGIRKDQPRCQMSALCGVTLCECWQRAYTIPTFLYDSNISIYCCWIWTGFFYNQEPLSTVQDFQQHHCFKIQERHYRSLQALALQKCSLLQLPAPIPNKQPGRPR